jgi:hypothetical protein
LKAAIARGFAGNYEAGAVVELGSEIGEFGGRKMVEDEVADDHGV